MVFNHNFVQPIFKGRPHNPRNIFIINYFNSIFDNIPEHPRYNGPFRKKFLFLHLPEFILRAVKTKLYN